MRILLIGPTGQVGWELARSLQPLGEVVACDRHRADLADPPGLARLVAGVAPNVVVNAAAYTAVDRAEQEPELAMLVNGVAPGVLADASRRAGALFVHYSTEYVFDGSGELPRDESWPVAPLNVYGQSKLAGEQAIAASGGDWLVLRTSWVYAGRGQNFVRTMLRLGAERESLRVVADQWGAPTSAGFIAKATAVIVGAAINERQGGRFVPGPLHLTASGEVSWHGFAETIFEGWRERTGSAELKVREVVPIPTSEYPAPAARPKNSRLDCSAVRRRFNLHTPDWRVGLGLVLDEIAEAPRGGVEPGRGPSRSKSQVSSRS